MNAEMVGPQSGLKITEMATIEPAPFCGMLYSDSADDIMRIDRREPAGLSLSISPSFDFTSRGRRSVTVDLKSEKGPEPLLKLTARLDALIESFYGVIDRPAPDSSVLLQRNP